jgi:L-asparaginase II
LKKDAPFLSITCAGAAICEPAHAVSLASVDDDGRRILSTASHPIILNLTKPSFNRSCEDIASRMKASIAPALLSRAMTDPRHVMRHRVVA